MMMRRWTPPSQVPTIPMDDNNNNNTTVHTQRTCSRWCKVFISALVAVALISFCIVYTLQKENFFNAKYQRQQHDEHEQRQRLLFDAYIQDISTVLLRINNKNSIDENILLHIQTKTLLILRNLDIKRKKDIILYLYETNLLQNNQLNLYSADFNHVQLTCPHDFHHLNLSGVRWLNAVLINCRLISANFNQAYLFNARFINSTLQNASFIGTNLGHSRFINTIIVNTDFTGASLLQANFLQADLVQGNSFRNADLYQANLTEDQFDGKKFSIIEHDFHQARYPNGSFQLSNSNENLIDNGNAEMECFTNNQIIWQTMERHMMLSAEPMTNNDSYWGNCSFLLTNKTRVFQNIDSHAYSLLIDTNNAEFSFFAYANCNQSYFEINLYRSDGILNGLKTSPKLMEEIHSDDHKTMHRYGEDQHHLPIHTRRIEVSFGIQTSETALQCYFDNITLTIHQNK